MQKMTEEKLLHKLSHNLPLLEREIRSKWSQDGEIRSKRSQDREIRSKRSQDNDNLKISTLKRRIRKSKSHINSRKNKNRLVNPIPGKTLLKDASTNIAKINKPSLMLHVKNSSQLGRKRNRKCENDNCEIPKVARRRKRKRNKKGVVRDESLKLQRRTRYLLIRMKLEQNLIDAYSGEGWKGNSREKIKPEKELQRARKQILKCKLGIRDTIHQLDLLSSEGCIENSVMQPDGSVFHEHIFCAKCKTQNVCNDNDIILCDGPCNRGFHQKCLEPPLATEKIPPGDQGWLCKFCECRMEILESINAHLGTNFLVNSIWQDIFKESANYSDEENTCLDAAEEWPSEDSQDDDYDPERNEESCNGAGTEGDATDESACSSSFYWSSDEGSPRVKFTNRNPSNASLFDSMTSINFEDTSDVEIMNCRRRRKDVDYKKLHDEMFGKEVTGNEQGSEDEDWGPSRKRQRDKDSELGTSRSTGVGPIECSATGTTGSQKKPSLPSQEKKKLFRIPPDAVLKLRLAFEENELPPKTVKEDLSKQLGLDFEKVSKWFKNARYVALKIRKERKDQIKCNNITNNAASEAMSLFEPLATFIKIPKRLRRLHGKNNSKMVQHKRKSLLPLEAIKKKLRTVMVNKNKSSSKFVKQNFTKQWRLSSRDQVSSQGDNAMSMKKRISRLRRSITSERETTEFDFEDGGQHYLGEMERLFCLENRIQRLKAKLAEYRDGSQISTENDLGELHVMYVPVAEVKEKAQIF
ncbi:hypothetical protein QJS04_geneDACA013956 [Acorus gramineus]|uniref:Pathogenesis-related homeodomain protein n=1 Tax=Acorus gramineus TaxID=55184 RepID=A0AAV9AX45_ACOGR|nr:hypothetical protein QJS04_geneDACA013956 [Acorus gramineus]